MRGPTVSYVLPYKKDKFHKFGVNKLLLSGDDSDRLYSCGRDSTVRVWDLRRPMDFNTEINQRSNEADSGINECERKMDDHTVPEVVFIGSQHSDWVNDMVMLNGGHKMISCSNDNTIMLWDMEPGNERHLHTYRHHIDYCKCLAYSAQGNFFVSGGFDNNIALWDLETMQMCIANKTRYTPARFKPQKNSVYSLAVEPMGRVLVSGSTDKFIRLYDSRSREKKMKLRGHQDMVKSVLINDDATMVVSASGDGTVKTWDLRQQRCFHTYHVHRDSVWTLTFDRERGQDYVVSGGRDKNVHYIDTKRNEVCHLLRAEHPVLSLAITPNRDYVWVSTTGSRIKKWHFKRKLESIKPKKIAKSSTSGSFTRLGASPLRSGDHRPLSHGPLNYPVTCIPGSPGILRHHILNDRRRVLALDSEGYVTLWDIARGHLEADYGKTDFDEKVEALFQYCSIPNWFSIERKTGSLEIVLEPLSVFNAEIYASDAGFNVIHEEDKINLGAMVIKALFTDWFTKRKARISRTKDMYMEQQAQRNAEMESKEQEMMRDEETDTPDIGAPNVESGPENDENGDEKMTDVPDDPKSPQVGEGGNYESNGLGMDATTHDAHTSDSPELAPHAINQNAAAKSSATEFSYDAYEEIQERELYHFTLPGSTSVIVHHEKLNPALAPFKKMLKDINGSEIEYRAIPRWIVDTLQQRDIQPTSTQKIGFFLEPYDPNDLPHFKDSKSKLTAHRILKIRKVCQFVVQNLQLKLPTVREWRHEQQQQQQQLLETRKRTRSDSVSSGAVSTVRKRHGDSLAQRFSNMTATIVNKVSKSPSRHDDDSLPATPDNGSTILGSSHQNDQQQGNIGESTSTLQLQQVEYQETEQDLSERLVTPEQYIEILCNDRVLSPAIDLGTVNSFFKGSQRTIILQYRKRREKYELYK